jgi:hypothetical protein
MKKRKPSGGRAAESGAVREQKAPDPRGGPLIGKGRGAPVEDPESPPVEHSRTPDEVERETVEGREGIPGPATREKGAARE